MPSFSMHETIIVVDFETTGMNPEQGDRVIEIGAVILRGEHIEDHFTTLLHPGFLVSREIENLTGITNSMLQDAPRADEILPDFISFIGSYPLVAHNAPFDQKFLEAELALFGKPRPLNFACTLKLARFLYPALPNRKLKTLVDYKRISSSGQFHRALADAQMTAQLWLAIIDDLKQRYDLELMPFDLIKKICRAGTEQMHSLLLDAAHDAKRARVDTTGHLF